MSKKVTLFNKGSRSFDTACGVLAPHATLDVEKETAEKLLKVYGKEIIKGGAPAADSGDSEKVKALSAEIAELKAAIAEKDSLIEELTKPEEKPKADKKK